MKNLDTIKFGNAALNCLRATGLRPWLRRCCAVVIAWAAASNAAGQVSVLTQHNDNGRTGQNTSETILNTTNVNKATFGRLFNMPVVGQVYAQPLYVPNITINGIVHNVLIVATEEDNVYAFDADSSGSPLWTASLVDTAHGANPGESALPSATTTGCTDTQPYVGITGTPVIDPTPGVMTVYVEAKSMTPSSTYIHRLHALDLMSGAEKPQGPVVVTATVSGTGDGSSGGQLTFDPLHHNSRPGLLLVNGSVYIAYASHCDDSPYHGWLFAYNASTLARESVFVTTPNGGLGGFWMSGAGIAADESGNIFISSGNGSFDTTNVPATELGDTLMKLGTSGGNLSLLDYFTPSDQNCLSTEDNDLGSGGVLVLPDQPGTFPHILVAVGKEGMVYVVNRDQMTLNNNHFENSNNCTSNDPQILEESVAVRGMFSLPVYWNSKLYFWAQGGELISIPLVNGLPSFTQATHNFTAINFPGATPSISSNGTAAGTAILWAVDNSQYGSPGPGPGPAVVYAFDPTVITKELWDSTQALNNRDTADNAVKFSVPTVVNGKVYVGGNSSVTVYGLLQIPAALTSPTPGAKLSGSSATFSWTQGASVTAYELCLGSTGVGASDLYNSGQISGTSANVTGLPTNGVKIYARLWSMIAGKWQSNDYTYTEFGTATQASLTSPTPGSALPGANVTFSWTAGTGPTQYELWLGSTGVGASDLYNSGAISATTASVTGLPTNGVKLYARLWSKISNAWQSTDYTYTEFGTVSQAALTSPAPGAVLSGANVTFSWTTGTGPTQYELWLSSVGVGLSELYNSGAVSATSASVTGLPTNGVKVYARLWSRINSVWQSTDYTYTEFGSPTLPALTSPTPGGQLSGANVTFSWSPGAGPTGYELWLGTTGTGSANLYNSGSLPTSTTSASVTGLPTNGVAVYATLWAKVNGVWQSINYTYTEFGSPTLAALTSPAPGSQLSGANVTFSWSPGAGPTAYELWLGTTGVGSSNLYNSGSLSTTSAGVTGLPTNGVIVNVRLWSLISGKWQSADYTVTEFGAASQAVLTSPTPGSQLPGANVTFSWTSGTGPVAYELWLGSTGAGSSNLYNSGSITATSASPTGLPTNGSTIYARLWSNINNAWQATDYKYTAQ